MDIEAQVGVPFEIVLERYGTAGYAWEVKELPDGVRPVEVSESATRAGAAPGDLSQQTFRFVAGEPGAYHLLLAMRRPWEAGPVRTEMINIAVR